MSSITHHEQTLPVSPKLNSCIRPKSDFSACSLKTEAIHFVYDDTESASNIYVWIYILAMAVNDPAAAVTVGVCSKSTLFFFVITLAVVWFGPSMQTVAPFWKQSWTLVRGWTFCICSSSRRRGASWFTVLYSENVTRFFFFFSSTHLVLQPPLASHLSCYCKKCKKEFLKLIINYIYMQHWGKKEKNNKRRRSFFFCLCFCAWLHRHSCFIRECGPRPTLHPPHHLCTD